MQVQAIVHSSHPRKAVAVPAATASYADSFQLSPEEQKELKTWKDRLRPELGQLQSPPIGAEDLAVAKNYLESILNRVAGNDLKNLRLRLEVFSGDIPQAGLDSRSGQEAAWKEEHAERPWPVRTWYGIPDDGQPFYRLTINAGMLRTLKTEDELAFILAQQVSQLLFHANSNPNGEQELSVKGNSWIEPQAMQAGADHNAIERMVAANYNPHASLSALERLYSNKPEQYPLDDQKRALKAGIDGHEHEGLRVALVQMQVEDYKRSGHPSTSVAETAIPAGIAGNSPPLYEKEVEDFPDYQQQYCELAEQLAQDSTPDWMFNNAPQPAQVAKIRFTEAARVDHEQALLGTCAHLTASDKTVQQQVDGFLRLLLSTEADALPTSFTPEALAQIREFVQRPGWSAAAFLSTLVKAPQSLERKWVQKIHFNEAFQQLGLQGDLLAKAPAMFCVQAQTGLSDVEQLVEFYRKNQDEPQSSWNLAVANDQALRTTVAALDGPLLARQVDKDGLPQALSLAVKLLNSPYQDADELKLMQTACQGILSAGATVREGHALLRLRPPLQDGPKVTAYLNGLFASEPWVAFTDEFNQQLPSVLLDVARTCSDQADFKSSSGRPPVLEPGAERRFCALKDPAADKFVLNHWAHEMRVPTGSSRRNWTQSLAQRLKPVEQADRWQHQQLLRSTLEQGYGVQLTDLSTDSLKSLQERHDKGEFEPRPEDFASAEDYYQARRDYQARIARVGQEMKFLAPTQSRLILAPLAVLGHDATVSFQGDFQSLLTASEEAVERSKTMRRLGDLQDEEPVGVDAGAYLVQGFVEMQGGIATLEQWYSLAQRVADLCPAAMQARPDTQQTIGKALYKYLTSLQGDELQQWLGKKDVLDWLNADQAADLVEKLVNEKAAVAELAANIASLDSSLQLRSQYPLVYHQLRNRVAEGARLQPGTVDQVFPPDPRDQIESLSVFSKEMRGLSSLVAIARGKSPEEQLETIEYLMGRHQEMPAYLENASEQQSFAPIAQSLRNVRAQLSQADPMARVVVANSFLAGPSGLLRNPQGREAVLQHFLKGVPDNHLSLASKVGQSILSSQGDADTLAVAFMLGQKPKLDAQGNPVKLDEASVLSRLFDSYGVPGIKMKQYLAFTSEFADFREAFESAQDSAMPLDHYQVLKLIQNRFGDEWPQDLTVDRVLGSGSVNVAIRYQNQDNGKHEVVSLGRQDIIETTRYDFDRFHKFLNSLTESPEDKERFGYILGLLGIIEDSVKLEFDKESAMAVQRTAFKAYQRQYGDWNVRSIDAYAVKNLGLFMEEAKGKTARKVFGANPKLYQQALQPMARTEMGILRGQTNAGNWLPQTTFANPDFHDGQVMIDEASKTVTILDFGQAVPIDNSQREGALDLLTVIGKADSAKAAAKRLNRRFFQGQAVLQAEDMGDILSRKERMDCFIHLLSLIAQKGAHVPIAAVHWVLGLNRQIALGNKLDQSVQKQVRNMVINHKLGLPLGVYNTVHAIRDKLVNMATELGHALISWAIPHESADQDSEITQEESPPEAQQTRPDSWAWNPADSFL